MDRCFKGEELTANPRLMVETFCKEYLGADEVIGTEIQVSKRGRATGFVQDTGILVGEEKAKALRRAFADQVPDVGVGDRVFDYGFISMCKEGYIVPWRKVGTLPRESLLRRMIFHDGRFVHRPTPLVALMILAYMPFGFVLALVRILCANIVPVSLSFTVLKLLGVKIKVKGTPPTRVDSFNNAGQSGVLFICSYRTLMDPVMLAFALRRHVSTRI
ncbi:hypothetical protein R1flu_023067 [Riccia fluitans]|uniref:Glycerol-3-phosphate acyltransferase RAM2/GPAT1-8 HAD-like domain-containing protein n=1 Tax=Riccia fluitans TaxID=41844 RepID=A0ABD1XQZ3_9MARC